MLHMKLLRSPHAHARILAIDCAAALALPGVHAVLTPPTRRHERFSTARHENPLDDPDDTRVLDDVVRFIGQRVAAVLADTEAAAEAGCRALRVEYEVLPAVFDPEAAMRPGAPLLHGEKGPEARIHDPAATWWPRSSYPKVIRQPGSRRPTSCIRRPIPRSGCSMRRWRRMRRSAGWMTTGGLMLRSSTQTPFLTRRALCDLFDLPMERVRVFCERVGGGFGGKQEMLTEDIVALAVLRTGRPVRLEFTREEQFIGAPSRHPMRVTVTLGARRDGTLTAMQLRVVSNAGAYGNHSAGVLYHGCGECIGGLSLPQQARRGLCGLHQHRAGGRVPRLWAEPDRVRGGIGDG